MNNQSSKSNFSDFSRTIDKLIVFFGLIGSIAGFLLLNSEFRLMVKNWIHLEKTEDVALFIAFTSLLCSFLWAIMFRVGKKSDRLIQKIDENLNSIRKNLISTDKLVEEIEAEFKERVVQGKKVDTIDILSYNMKTVADHLSDWNRNGFFKNLIVNIYHLDPQFIASNSAIFDQRWIKYLEINKEEIDKFLSENFKVLKKSNVTINFYPYHHIPAVHGFRLPNKNIFVSIAAWDNNYRIASVDGSAKYKKISPVDYTDEAKEMRKLFGNWLNKARHSNHLPASN